MSALRRGPVPHGAAAALRTTTGEVVTAVALPGTCAEAAALCSALSRAAVPDTVAAVRHVDADRTRVVAPCRSCRALLQAYAPAVRVVHLADGLRVSGLATLPH